MRTRTLPIRAAVTGGRPYRWQSGLPATGRLLRFDMNTMPAPPSWYPRMQARLARVPVNEYPDASYARLREALAGYTGVPAAQIIPTAGADEALALCALAALEPGDTAYARRPRYGVYETAAHAAGGAVADEPDEARLRFVCAPHNPTGGAPDDSELEEFDGLLVIDQAYMEFGGADLAPLVLEREATVVVRSLSKAFGLAGARVGYVLAPEPLAGPLDALRLPAGISAHAAAVAELALERTDEMRTAVAGVLAERDRMARALRAAGYRVSPSQANFLLVESNRPAAGVAAGLLAEGMVVRTFTDPLLGQAFRISPSSPSANDLLLAALGAGPVGAGGPPPPQRTAVVERRTAETDIRCRLALDGSGRPEVATGIGFLDHMLTALACHSLIDLELACWGDLWVDAHHTLEDVAIVLGQAVDEALGERSGIRRFGDSQAPLDEALAHVTIDLSGRGMATCDVRLAGPVIGELPASLVPHFFETLARTARIGLHVRASGSDDHHVVEASFKALALALRGACERDPRRDGVPSTKDAL